MNILRLSFAAVIVHFCCLTIAHQGDDSHDISNWKKKRSKRFLIYQTSGVHKYIISLALPVDLFDKKSWRSLSGAWAFQWQHNLPISTQLWWNSTYFPAKGRKLSSDEGILPLASSVNQPDLTATFIYLMLESYMDKNGVNGRACLQRSICENAQVHYVGGVFDRIFQRLLTPESTMEDYYKDPYVMGKKGVNCYRTFSACPKGDAIFDKFVQIQEVP